MMGDGRREKLTRLFFLEIRPYRSAAPWKAPEPLLVAAYGVKELAPAAVAAPELPFLGERFSNSRPTLTMGGLSQKEGPIELVIARDYKRYWPRLTDTSCFATDDLHLMKSVFHPEQLLFGEADPEAVGTMRKGVKRRLTQGTGESVGSSTSLSRRSQEATPAVDPSEKRRHDPPPQTRGEEKEKKRASSPSPRSTSSASSEARSPQETSTPSRGGGGDKKDESFQERDEKDKSVEKRDDESPVRKTPARKKRMRKISSSRDSGSSSSSSSNSSSSSDSSSSEDEAMA